MFKLIRVRNTFKVIHKYSMYIRVSTALRRLSPNFDGPLWREPLPKSFAVVGLSPKILKTRTKICTIYFCPNYFRVRRELLYKNQDVIQLLLLLFLTRGTWIGEACQGHKWQMNFGSSVPRAPHDILIHSIPTYFKLAITGKKNRK